MLKFLGVLSTALILAAILWLAGLIWFVRAIPVGPVSDEITTDAIIVLTGGNNRLEDGFRLFKQGRAQAMLVSGVGEKVTLSDLVNSQKISGFSGEQLADISLGRKADSTATNASETRDWMQEHHFTSLRLVTANYHMPRSLLEFSAQMPGITIVADPSFPEDFKLQRWWKDPPSRKIVLLEYHKTIAAWLRTR